MGNHTQIALPIIKGIVIDVVNVFTGLCVHYQAMKKNEIVRSKNPASNIAFPCTRVPSVVFDLFIVLRVNHEPFPIRKRAFDVITVEDIRNCFTIFCFADSFLEQAATGARVAG